MLVIRLQRTGRENTPTYRVVLSEKTKSAKKGAQEIFGHYLPSRATPVFECNQERILYWVKLGAHPSDTVARLLRKAGMKDVDRFIERYAKKKPRGEEPQAAAPVKESAAEKEPQKEEKEEPKKDEKPEEKS